MQNDVIDEVQEGNITPLIKVRSRQAALWQIIASSTALLLIFFAFMLTTEEFKHKFMFRTEEMVIEFFLLCSAVRFVFLLISGIKYRMATGRTTQHAYLLTAAKQYNIGWIITGCAALVFAMGMFLYIAAKVELFGFLSRELFDIYNI